MSDTTSNNNNDNKTNKVSFPENSVLGSDDNNKATASSIVIAGCYLGSAWAYLSAWILFSEQFQLQLANDWGYDGSVWPLVFYVNGIISMICLVVFRNEFDFTLSLGSRFRSQPNAIIETNKNNRQNIAFASTQSNLWDDTVNIAKETLSSKSGRAILAAQIGQGALLYTIASWGPLYLERINNAHSAAGLIDAVDAASSSTSPTFVSKPSSPVSPVTTAASKAASSLVFPQLTQALVGISIGATADQFSAKIGTRFTRRILQILSGVGPAIVLWYLATAYGDVADVASISVSDGTAETSMLSPPALFGAAQTISALSLGAVSVSHLDIATPSTAGAVYALGNVAAAASGSLMVNLLGRWLERESGASGISSEIIGGGREFDVPFRVVALLSAVGSLLYGCTVETELEIGVNRTRIDE